jgi:hypothetical protein
MVTVIDFLEDKFGPGTIKVLAFSDFVFKPGDRVKCKSGVKACEFMVPHRVGLKAVFGDTAGGWSDHHLDNVRDNNNAVDGHLKAVFGDTVGGLITTT